MPLAQRGCHSRKEWEETIATYAALRNFQKEKEKKEEKNKLINKLPAKGGIYYMKEGCPVYNLSFVRDQTQDHKIRIIRPLNGTHARGKGDVDDLGVGEKE